MTRSGVRQFVVPAAITAAAGALGGFALAAWSGAGSVGHMLPWVLGRGLGIAAYLALTALAGLGIWLRHPWRVRSRGSAPASLLRVHAILAALTGVLVIGHVVALVLDKYAGVGWAGAVVPGQSHYRPLAVALGTASLYLGVLVGGTAALAGRLFGRAWRKLHRFAFAAFGLVWLHGLLAGSDSVRLRLMYVATGAGVLALGATSRLASRTVLARRPA